MIQEKPDFKQLAGGWAFPEKTICKCIIFRFKRIFFDLYAKFRIWYAVRIHIITKRSYYLRIFMISGYFCMMALRIICRRRNIHQSHSYSIHSSAVELETIPQRRRHQRRRRQRRRRRWYINIWTYILDSLFKIYDKLSGAAWFSRPLGDVSVFSLL